MINFIYQAILWTFALYGVFEIIKTIVYVCTYNNFKSDGIYLIIAVKNQGKKIEGFMRSLIFRILYGKEDIVKDIIVTDLDSKDDTMQILEKLSKDYDCLQTVNWRECKEMIDRYEEKC